MAPAIEEPDQGDQLGDKFSSDGGGKSNSSISNNLDAGTETSMGGGSSTSATTNSTSSSGADASSSAETSTGAGSTSSATTNSTSSSDADASSSAETSTGAGSTSSATTNSTSSSGADANSSAETSTGAGSTSSATTNSTSSSGADASSSAGTSTGTGSTSSATTNSTSSSGADASSSAGTSTGAGSTSSATTNSTSSSSTGASSSSGGIIETILDILNPVTSSSSSSSSATTNSTSSSSADASSTSSTSSSSSIETSPYTVSSPYVPTKSSLCTPNSESQTFASGDGSYLNPYLICNKTQFARLSSYPNLYFALGADIDFANAYISPIVNLRNITLDGRNYTIKNYKIIHTGDYSANIGLFGSVYNCNIMNIRLDNFNVQGRAAYHTGGFVGRADYSRFYNIHAKNGTVSGYGVWYTGGVVGAFYRSQIVESSSSVNVYPGLQQSPSNASYPALVHGTSSLVGGSGNGHDLCIIFNSQSSGTTNGWAYWPGTLTGGYGGGGTAVVVRNGLSYGSVYNQTSNGVGGVEGLNPSNHSVQGYYNTDTLGGKLISNPSGTGLNTAALQSSSSYLGWDMQDVWSPPSNSYPTLRRSYNMPSVPRLLSVSVPGVTPSSSGTQLSVGSCSLAQLSLSNLDKTPVLSTANLSVSFFTQKIQVYSDSSCTTPLANAVIPVGESSTTIYIKAEAGLWNGYPLFLVPIANSVLVDALIGYN